MLIWLRREFVALIGVVGEATTILSQLSNVVPMAPWLANVLAWWRDLTQLLWRSPFELVGLPLHPHLAGAFSAAVFMTVIGVGGRVSAEIGGTPLKPLLTARWLDDMSWPSVGVFAAFCMVFLLGHDPNPSASAPLTLFGSEGAGQYAFALVVTAGYIAGDFVGHHEFHRRLYRVAALVLATVALDFALRWALW